MGEMTARSYVASLDSVKGNWRCGGKEGTAEGCPGEGKREETGPDGGALARSVDLLGVTTRASGESARQLDVEVGLCMFSSLLLSSGE